MKTHNLKLKSLVFGLCSLIYINSYAQKADPVLARVSYKLIHIDDTTQKDKPHEENMLLILGKNASLYTSEDKINKNKNIQSSIEKQMKEQTGSGTFNLSIGDLNATPTTNYDIYRFAAENKLYTRETLINSYLIEDKDHQINWKITKDTASFLGVKCQKATAQFKGREWIAWFSNDYPMSAGPWKLNGLPGLIIQAYDSKNEVKFEFEGIEFVKNQGEAQENKNKTLEDGKTVIMLNGLTSNYFEKEIKLPTNSTPITQKEFDKLKEIRDKDPQGFARTQMSSIQTASGVRTGTSITPSQISSITINAGGGNKATNKKVINNPIDLSIKP